MQKQIVNVESSYSKLKFLDGLRGFAAVYVLIGHARWLLWEGYSEGYLKHPDSYSFFQKALMYFLSLFKFGHEMVLFFFVLSGFVIHLKYARDLLSRSGERFGYSIYLVKRIRRIYPPFIFALLLTLLLDWIGRQQNYLIYTGATNNELINENMGNSNWDYTTFFGNIAFLYKTYVPIFGTNMPAWSLKYEWWFYMLYPAFLYIGRKHILVPSLLILLLFGASYFPAIWPEQLTRDVFSIMIAWWLGVILAEVYAGRLRWKFSWLIISSISLLIAYALFKRPESLSDLAVAVFFFGLISLLFLFKPSSVLIRSIAKLKFFGDFSYTLYIIHFPILVLFSGWVMSKNNNELPAHFYYVFLGILIILLLAYLFHFVTEKPFIKKGKIKKVTNADTTQAVSALGVVNRS